MANIRVDVGYTIQDGAGIVFRSPVDCSQITGLIVYYPGEDGNTTSSEFALADAHGNNVGDIDHLFAENVVVKVILDVTAGMAYVQNADTNAYLEGRFEDIMERIQTGGGGGSGADGVSCTHKWNGTVLTITSASGTSSADLKGEKGDTGAKGDDGDPGRGIVSTVRTSGTGAAGTTDTYTITYTDGTKSTFTVYNGANGKDGTGVHLQRTVSIRHYERA